MNIKKILPLKFLKKHNLNVADILATVLCILFAVAGSAVSVIRFWQYDVFYYDFGIFDQAIWEVAHFKAPIIEHFVHRGQWIFADHFNPSIFLFSPLYWFINRSEIILITQAVVFAVSGFLVYKLGKIITKNNWYSLSILFCFFLFTGLQNAIITDFHEASISVLFLLLVFLSLLKKKYLWFWISLLLMMGAKESNSYLAVAIGLTIIFMDRKNWKLGLATIIISIMYGFIATRIIIPHFSDGSYQYSIYLSPNPFAYINSLINDPIKIKTIFYSLSSFGFLPLLYPPFYILILEDFLARFYPPYLTLSWGLGFHYNAVTAAIMALSSLFAFGLIQKIKNEKIIYAICILLALNAFFLYRFILRGPFALAYNSAFYGHTKDFAFENNLIDKVPHNASVATQNNLAAHLDHQKVYLVQDKCRTCKDYLYVTYKPQYIVIDARSGQNLNDFYGLSDYQKFLSSVLKDKNYKVIYHQGDQYIFKRV